MLGCGFQDFLIIFAQKSVENDEAMAIGVTSRAVSVQICETMLVSDVISSWCCSLLQ